MILESSLLDQWLEFGVPSLELSKVRSILKSVLNGTRSTNLALILAEVLIAFRKHLAPVLLNEYMVPYET